MLALVKACLKAGILTEFGDHEDTHTGTPQGGMLSPLLANIALSVLDEHLHAPWKPGGAMATSQRRQRRRGKNLPNWRLVRYADDFVMLVHGSHCDVEQLRQEIAQLLAPIGLRLSAAKTRIVHLRERKRGTNQWHVYTLVADRPFRSRVDQLLSACRRQKELQSSASLFVMADRPVANRLVARYTERRGIGGGLRG